MTPLGRRRSLRRVGFDGAGPERDSVPTWRGVLMTALIVVVIVALIFLAYSFALTETRAR